MLVYNLSKIMSMSDKELYKYCEDVGAKARVWKKRFVALLPEVAKRNLHRKCGFASIVDFAGRLGGVGEYTVELALQIQKHIHDKPALLNVLPEVGVHKMRVIATIATKENQEFLAKKVVEMSKPALQVWAREIRPRPENFNENKISNGLNGAQNNLFSNPNDFENFSHMSSIDERIHYSFDVDKSTDFKLRKCKLEMEKAIKRYATWCEVMQNLIDDKTKDHKVNSPKNIAQGNNNSQNKLHENKNITQDKNNKGSSNPQLLSNASITRYIPAVIKRDIDDKYQGKCGYPGCNKPAEVMHHTIRFALQPNHENIVPLCANHHEIAHNGLIKNESTVPSNWQTGVEEVKQASINAIDKKVRLFNAPLRPINSS